MIHAHPPAQVLCSMADVEIKPIVGSQNWGGHDVARQGVAVYPRTMTIVNHVLARAVVAMMSNKNVVLLKAHGNVVAGRNVEEATVRAIQTENIARLCWEIAKVQRNDEYVPWTIPWEDVDNMTSGLPMREASEAQGGGPRRMSNASWEYYVQMLQAGALIPPESTVGRHAVLGALGINRREEEAYFMADALQELKEKQVLSHRILTMLESMGDITGHVFIRVPGADEFMARCRNDYDVSPGYVQQEAIHRMNFDGIPTEPGRRLDHPAGASHWGGRFSHAA